jgi:predicted Zn-dependent peptidase
MPSRTTGGHGHTSVPPLTSTPAETRAAADGTDMMAESVLDCGVHVLSEYIPSVRSASVGVWFRQGGAHELLKDTGVSHLLEHMVFKGTERRSAAEIAMALEGLGGSLDAYTSREHTSYQARVLDEHLGEALDVLADLVFHPLLRGEDLELEREVVLEEVAQVEDTPDDLVFELHSDLLWQGHPYGRSILGTKDSVTSMSIDTLRDLHSRTYHGQNLIVGAAGNVKHGPLVELVEGLFGSRAGGRPSGEIATPGRTLAGEHRIARTTAQTHVVLGTGVPGHAHKDRYPLALISSALGGGMSSRLFQKVREELGLCYSVYTYQSFYSASGLSGVYVGTRPATADAAVDAISHEMARMAEFGLTADELEQTKRQVKGQVMLSLESTGARLYRLASLALHREPFLGLDGLLRRIDSVTVEDVCRVAAEFYHPDRQLEVRLGPEAPNGGGE